MINKLGSPEVRASLGPQPDDVTGPRDPRDARGLVGALLSDESPDNVTPKESAVNAPLQRVYRVSQPPGMTRLTGGDFDGSGAVTGVLTTTHLSGDRRGWLQCHTRASPIEDLDLATCLASDGPVRDQLGELLTNLLAGAHASGGRRRRMLSGRGPACPRYGLRRRRRQGSAMINAEAMRNG